jgi:hypothetical protein
MRSAASSVPPAPRLPLLPSDADPCLLRVPLRTSRSCLFDRLLLPLLPSAFPTHHARRQRAQRQPPMSMWRFSRSLLRAASSAGCGAAAPLRPAPPLSSLHRCCGGDLRRFASFPDAATGEREPEAEVTPAEARRLMRLANVEALKHRLGDGEVIPYADLLRACEEAGAARTRAEAGALAGALDEAGVVLLFRDRVYLQPNKVSRASPSFAPPYILLRVSSPRRIAVRFVTPIRRSFSILKVLVRPVVLPSFVVCLLRGTRRHFSMQPR